MERSARQRSVSRGCALACAFSGVGPTEAGGQARAAHFPGREFPKPASLPPSCVVSCSHASAYGGGGGEADCVRSRNSGAWSRGISPPPQPPACRNPRLLPKREGSICRRKASAAGWVIPRPCLPCRQQQRGHRLSLSLLGVHRVPARMSESRRGRTSGLATSPAAVPSRQHIKPRAVETEVSLPVIASPRPPPPRVHTRSHPLPSQAREAQARGFGDKLPLPQGRESGPLNPLGNAAMAGSGRGS